MGAAPEESNEEQSMSRLGLAAAFLLVCILPAEGQQLADLVAQTQRISPSDPGLSGLILDTVTPLAPLRMPGLLTPLARPGLDPAAPTSGIGYDRLGGSSYRWTKAPSGGTRLRGIIPASGWSAWSGSISASGTLSGTDSNLNPFRYNPRTGNQTNTITGESCLGQGIAGPCR
jgi:hypothetical protein